MDHTSSLPHRLSNEERLHREEIVRFARANVELEGFIVSAAAEKHIQRFLDGKIDIDEFAAGPPYQQFLREE